MEECLCPRPWKTIFGFLPPAKANQAKHIGTFKWHYSLGKIQLTKRNCREEHKPSAFRISSASTSPSFFSSWPRGSTPSSPPSPLRAHGRVVGGVVLRGRRLCSGDKDRLRSMAMPVSVSQTPSKRKYWGSVGREQNVTCSSSQHDGTEHLHRDLDRGFISSLLTNSKQQSSRSVGRLVFQI